MQGNAQAYLPLIHYAFLLYNKTVSDMIGESQFELA